MTHDASDGDLVEWISYLKDIGVRELHVPAARRVAADAAAAVRPREKHPRGGGPPAATTVLREPAAAAPKAAASAPTPVATSPALPPFAGDPPADRAACLATIRQDLGDCTRCKLHEKRTNIVFGVGDPEARLMFVGEGPGADEDARGEPFVGKAGRKLDEMIAAIGLAREQVYIANIVKCRPPNNRDPKPDEVATCSPFLHRQIEAIRPTVIVALGSPAAKTLLRTKIGITRLRGRFHDYAGIPVMPTFHPAYLLRSYTPENRRKVYEDLLAARARLDEPT